MIILMFEFIYTIIFALLIIKHIENKNYRAIIELFSIVIFTLILEYMAIKVYDAYYYSSHFVVQFGHVPKNVPLVIALAWALIIYSSMKFSDSIKIEEKGKPFLDVLIALTIDLSMDAIAIRIEGGMWSWNQELSNSITFDNFLGVRYGNFIGWYLIVGIFSTLIRLGRIYLYHSSKLLYSFYMALIPVFAFIPFYIIFETIQQLRIVFNFTFYFPLVVVMLIFFAVWICYRSLNQESDSTNALEIYDILIYYSFHLFFLVVLIIKQFYIRTPLLMVISILSILIHFWSFKQFSSSEEVNNFFKRRNSILSIFMK